MNVTYTDAPRLLDGFLASEGVTGIPIARTKTNHFVGGTTNWHAALKASTEAFVDPERVYADAVAVYRQALVDATSTVDIISVGLLNNMQELLASPADGISALTGAELVAAKVRYLWVMGGKYPTGIENNFSVTPQSISAAVYVTANWPTPVIYSGHEIGDQILTGGNLVGTETTDILAKALLDWGAPNGRNSYDPMATMAAIVQNTVMAGYAAARGTQSVNASTGANTFTADSAGKDLMLIKNASDATFQSKINSILDKTNWGVVDPYP